MAPAPLSSKQELAALQIQVVEAHEAHHHLGRPLMTDAIHDAPAGRMGHLAALTGIS